MTSFKGQSENKVDTVRYYGLAKYTCISGLCRLHVSGTRRPNVYINLIMVYSCGRGNSLILWSFIFSSSYL